MGEVLIWSNDQSRTTLLRDEGGLPLATNAEGQAQAAERFLESQLPRLHLDYRLPRVVHTGTFWPLTGSPA